MDWLLVLLAAAIAWLLYLCLKMHFELRALEEQERRHRERLKEPYWPDTDQPE